MSCLSKAKTMKGRQRALTFDQHADAQQRVQSGEVGVLRKKCHMHAGTRCCDNGPCNLLSKQAIKKNDNFIGTVEMIWAHPNHQHAHNDTTVVTRTTYRMRSGVESGIQSSKNDTMLVSRLVRVA